MPETVGEVTLRIWKIETSADWKLGSQPVDTIAPLARFVWKDLPGHEIPAILRYV